MVSSFCYRALSLYICQNCTSLRREDQISPIKLCRRPDFPKLFSRDNIVSLPICNCSTHVSAWASPQPVLQQLEQNEDFPTSAAVITAAVNAVACSTVEFSHRTQQEPEGVFSGPSADFLELCQQQLAVCDSLFGHNAKLTIYTRPVESYGTPVLELRWVAAYPSWTVGKREENLVLVGNFETDVIRSAESALLEKETMELPELGALVLPMVKDLFLVGILVAEWIGPKVQDVLKSNKLKAVRPEWPPSKGGSQIQQLARFGGKKDESIFTSHQKQEGRKIARSLAIACVMDQRTLLLQQSSWQRGVRVGDLLEKIRGSLAAIRTLGKMLQPQMKRGEISTDVLEDILIQGEHMKDVVQKFQEVIYLNESPSKVLLKEDSLKDDGEPTREKDPSLAVHDANKPEPARLHPMISVGHSSERDKEAPMPPLALAPLMHSGTNSCNVSKLLVDLVSSGAVLARKKGQALELKQNPDEAPFYAAINESSLRQAFSNLLDSSLQHILPGGWVKVEVMRAPGGGVLVTIDDNGPDLSLMSQAQALAPLGSGLQAGGHGRIDTPIVLGVGAELNIAQDILEQYGGVLRITSPHMPKTANGIGGTRLEVWLPSPPLKDEPLP